MILFFLNCPCVDRCQHGGKVSEYNHNFGGRTAGKTVGGKFQSWVLDENLSGYLFTEHNPSLICDPHPTQKQCKVKEFCTQIGTTLMVLEAQTQWANRAELYIGLIKEATRKDMRASGSPLVLWDYCMER